MPHSILNWLLVTLAQKSNMFVFFYDDDEVYSHKIIRGLEKLDDELHSAQGTFLIQGFHEK